MTAYSKFLSALAAAAISALAAQVIGGHVTQVGLVNVALAVVTAALVYVSPNVPGLAPYSKALVAGLGAGAQVLATIIGAGSLAALTPSELAQIGIAVVNVAVVYFVRNSPPLPAPAPARR